jgi:hypothetical protein
MLKNLFILLGLFLLLACGSDGKSQGKVEVNTIQEKAKVNKALFECSPSAAAITDEWTEFKFLTTKMMQIIKESENTAVEVLDELDKAIKKVEETIPEGIQNPSLNARFTVLKTQVGLYKDIVTAKIKGQSTHVRYIHNIIDAFNHCVFQINDIVEKLETEARFKDLQ